MKLSRLAQGTLVAGLILVQSGCGGAHDIDGAALAMEKGCVACHGIDGKAIAPIYPNLNGQWERYLRVQLHSYRDNKRQNAVMNGMAANLTDEDIAILAAHYGD